MTAALSSSEREQARVGVCYGVAAYTWWGVVAIYFKAVAHVNPFEVLAHRVIGAALLLGLFMRVQGKWTAAFEALRNRRTVFTLLGSTALIAVNWFVFIWAVANNHLMEASLGYFINPLVNVFLGFVVLKERLRAWQWVSVALAASGVSYLTYAMGALPLIALVLAGSFAMYGLLRKTVGVDALTGLTFETTLLWPLAVGFVVWLEVRGNLAFAHVSRRTDVLLSIGGIVTAAPLLWFSNAARRLRLSTLGFLQYIAPSMQFMLAVLIFGEPFERMHAISFGLIWAGLTAFSIESIVASRRRA